MTLSPAELEQFVCDLASTPALWEPFVTHAHERRVFEQIWDDGQVNAWVICWSEDSDTGFHDHDDSGASILVVSGQVREERLQLAGTPRSRVIGAGAPFFIPPTAIHRVLHSGSAPAVTIHAYSPPLRRTGAYEVGPTGDLERTSQSFEEELRAQAISSAR